MQSLASLHPVMGKKTSSFTHLREDWWNIDTPALLGSLGPKFYGFHWCLLVPLKTEKP